MLILSQISTKYVTDVTIPTKLYTTYNIEDLEEEMIKAERYNDLATLASLREYAQWILLT